MGKILILNKKRAKRDLRLSSIPFIEVNKLTIEVEESERLTDRFQEAFSKGNIRLVRETKQEELRIIKKLAVIKIFSTKEMVVISIITNDLKGKKAGRRALFKEL